MSETLNSPLTSFLPEDDIVTTMGAPNLLAAAERAAPFTNMYRAYTPPAPGSFDPLTVGITGAIPAFFSYRQPSSTRAATAEVTTTAAGGEGDWRFPALQFVPNAPGQQTLGGGPAGGTFVASPGGPPASPGTGNFLTDIQRALSTPGMRDAALALLTGPGAIPSIIAGTALSQLGSDPRVTTIGGALRDLLVDYARRTPEERELRREAAEGLNREAIREAETRQGITREELSPLENITQTYEPAQDTGTTVRDTGTTVVDTGTTVRDTGTTVQDTGTTVRDTGTTVRDTGTTNQDTGTTITAVTTTTPVQDTGTTRATTETPFGVFATPSSAIDALYESVLSRDPDTGAEAYWLDRVSKVGWDNALREFGIGAAKELGTRGALEFLTTPGDSFGSETTAPTGTPGTGNIAQDLGSFLSEPAVQDAAISLGLGAISGGLGAGIASAAKGALSAGVMDAIAEAFGLSKGSDASVDATQAANQTMSDAVAAGIGPESPGYGSPSSTDDTSPSSPSDSNSDAPSGPDGGSADGSAYAEGGLVQFAEGGLVPLAGGGKIAVGPGGGLDDLIPTSINGRRAAALSDGEFVIPADVVSMMGDGSSNAGARRLYDLVRQVRDAKTGTTRQAGPLPVGEILKRSIGR